MRRFSAPRPVLECLDALIPGDSGSLADSGDWSFADLSGGVRRGGRNIIAAGLALCFGLAASSRPLPAGVRRVGVRVVAAGLALCFGLAATTLTPTPTHACDGLLVYAGAGFRGPIEEAAARFEAREGVPIDATFAGSGCLLAQAELAGRGDVFLPGELHYLRNAADRGLTESSTCLAYLRPVIAVRRGNPLGIKGPEDLAREGLRVGLGDQEAVAVGLAAERWLRASLGSPLYDALQTNCVTRALNVNELGTQLTLGALDAVVVWDATVPLFPGLEAVVSESSAEFRTVISGATLSMSDWPDESGRFLAFLASDEGRAIFREHGYEPIGGPCLGDEFDALPTSSTTTNDNAHE